MKKKRYEAEGAKEYREANRRVQKAVKKAKEDWIGAQCEKIETCLNISNSWLVGCFGLSGPLRQYFSLYRAVSQREGERRERIDESKNVQTTPTRTYCKRSRPMPYRNPNCRTPRHWKLTQHHRTTRPPRISNSKRSYQRVKDPSSEKQGRSSTIQDKSGKCLTEEKEILSRWTEYCSELYNYESCGGNAVLDCSQLPEEDLQPILREEVEIAVASLKKGKSAGIDNIPAELA